VAKVDTGAGEVRFDAITVATVVREPEGDVCDDSCEWALDGVCDDGTAPTVDDDWGTREGRRWDDDWGGYLYDDDYEGGWYDDEYGAYFDDSANDLPACPYGTDCTDCQPLHGDSANVAKPDAECDNTCEFSRDGFCDDARTNGYCALGTDCQDFGPASAGNFSTYDDDAWWDDDEGNWYWDDEYYGAGAYDDFYDDDARDRAGAPATDDGEGAVGYVRSSPNPFDPNDDFQSQDAGAAGLFLGALLITGIAIGGCVVLKMVRGGKICDVRVGGEKADLNRSWNEMTANPSSKKTNVPITPDVTFSGGSVV